MTNFEKKNEKAGLAYIKYFETLTAGSVDELDELATEQMQFKDPFNNVTTREDTKRVFREMFDQIDNPVFQVTSVSWNDDRDLAALKWCFTGHAGKLGNLEFEGMSEIRFDEEGKVVSHIDFWDAASHFYEKIIFLGFFIRLIKRSIRLS